MKIRIATRKSQLAIVQTEWVVEQLRVHEPDLEVELLEMTTMGDRMRDVSLASIGGKGLFVSELEHHVLEGNADLAVHSMKDLPAELAEGLSIVCVPEREDPRDALVTMEGVELDDLSAGDRVGTNSGRRVAQLRRLRNDLDYALLRGSVNTRLAKLEAGEYQAIVLACAGLKRLNLFDRPLWAIPESVSVPAVGQGALALQTRDDADELNALLAKIEHRETRICVEGERAFLAELGGDCHSPLAGYARFGHEGSRLRFEGLVGTPHDERMVRAAAERYTEDAGDLTALSRQLGREVARQLLSQGAAELIREAAEDAAARDPRRRPV
jgi:hydroxymethylbilane synthase